MINIISYSSELLS